VGITRHTKHTEFDAIHSVNYSYNKLYSPTDTHTMRYAPYVTLAFLINITDYKSRLLNVKAGNTYSKKNKPM
jgi:hypothetical protein